MKGLNKRSKHKKNSFVVGALKPFQCIPVLVPINPRYPRVRCTHTEFSASNKVSDMKTLVDSL